MKTGLVSVSFRALTPDNIISLAAESGLNAIEWGGDVHVPAGDIAGARRVGEATRAAGLSVACYGSYYRLTDAQTGMAQRVTETAQALGAPMIRVWAGEKGSAQATERDWDEICRNAGLLADLAAQHGIDVVLEWHGGTLTDTLPSALRLLRTVSRPNLGTLWQPPVGMGAEECAAQIRAAGEFIRNIHVFSWRGIDRLPLEDGEAKWRACLPEIEKLPGDRTLLLEFVAGDDPRQLPKDAETLRRWMRGEWRE